MELIARKKDGIVPAYILVGIGGLALIIYGITWFNKAVSVTLVSLIGGLCLIAICVFYIVKISKTPEEIIRFDGEKLYFPEGSYYPDQIEKVHYHQAHARGFRYYSWGKLSVYFADKVLEYCFVEDVQDVHNRLLQLKMENIRKQNADDISNVDQ